MLKESNIEYVRLDLEVPKIANDVAIVLGGGITLAVVIVKLGWFIGIESKLKLILLVGAILIAEAFLAAKVINYLIKLVHPKYLIVTKEHTYIMARDNLANKVSPDFIGIEVVGVDTNLFKYINDNSITMYFEDSEMTYVVLGDALDIADKLFIMGKLNNKRGQSIDESTEE